MGGLGLTDAQYLPIFGVPALLPADPQAASPDIAWEVREGFERCPLVNNSTKNPERIHSGSET